jgi:hypothetical protein
MPTLRQIISGGQTGVDRGALDAAIARGMKIGGWCPADRSAEDGAIAPQYPLLPAPKPGNRERTLRNVVDSDGTLILYFATLVGGTQETLRFCMELQRPYLLIDASEVPPARAAERSKAFVAEHQIEVLNVAGPRASGWTQGYDFAKAVIFDLIG